MHEAVEATCTYKRNIPSLVKSEIKEIEDIIQEQGQGMHDFHIDDEILTWLRGGGSIQACDTKFNMQLQLH